MRVATQLFREKGNMSLRVVVLSEQLNIKDQKQFASAFKNLLWKPVQIK